MKRSLWMGTLFLAGAGALAAQQASQDRYEGTSAPPPDDMITTQAPQEPVAKPAPGRPMTTQEAAPAQQAPIQTPMVDPPPAPGAEPAQNFRTASEPALGEGDGTDDGIVMLAPDSPTQPALNRRDAANDPDGDIVHPSPLPAGTLADGTMIRARLLDRLSTTYSAEGDAFRAKVASDVIQDGQVLIPAGAEIDGAVGEVSTGHLGGHGSMVLRPQTVTLPNGSRFRLYAQVASTPGANMRVGGEGTITPGSRMKKDGIEYGTSVGVGVVAGGVMGGPAGALAGSLVGAGAVTVHLLMDHPQATLEEGTVLMFSLTQPLHLEPAVGPQASDAQTGAQGNVTQ